VGSNSPPQDLYIWERNFYTMVSQPFRISNYHSASPKSRIRRRIVGGVQIPPPWKINEWNPMAGEEEWIENTEIWKAIEGKGDGHQHGRKPRIPEPVPIAYRNSTSEEKWGDIGCLRALSPWSNGWMNSDMNNLFVMSRPISQVSDAKCTFFYLTRLGFLLLLNWANS